MPGFPFQVVFGQAATNGFRGITSPPEYGLLFNHNGSMVMNGVGVDLDAVFLDDRSKITDILTMKAEPPASLYPENDPYAENNHPRAYYKGHGLYNYVLELPAGFCVQNGWKVGGYVKLTDGVAEYVEFTQQVPLSQEAPQPQSKTAQAAERMELAANVLPLDVLRYLLGPCAARWGEQAVKNVLDGLEVSFDPPETSFHPETAVSVNDLASFHDFRRQRAFLVRDGDNPPVLHIEETNKDPFSMVYALAKGIHREATMADSIEPIDAADVREAVKRFGLNTLNAKFYTEQILDILSYYRAEEMMAKMEVLLFMEETGHPEWEMRKWLLSITPDAIKDKDPGVLDFLFGSYRATPEALEDGGWPLELRTVTPHDHTKEAGLASSVSYPKESMDPELWWSGFQHPELKTDVRNAILERLYTTLKDFGFSHPEKWCARVLLVGSEAGNQYDDDSDIDISLIVDFDAFRECEDDKFSAEDIRNLERDYLRREMSYLKTAQRQDAAGVYRRRLVESSYRIAEKLIREAISDLTPHQYECPLPDAQMLSEALQKQGSILSNHLRNAPVPLMQAEDQIARNISNICYALHLPREQTSAIEASLRDWFTEYRHAE